MKTAHTRNAPINIRALPKQRNLIDQASALLGKNRSDFMLETACREAENILLNQRLFQIDTEVFTRFEAKLTEPVSDNTALRNLMTISPPWQG